MSEIAIAGIGAVSPAGWGVPALRLALRARQPIAEREVARPGWTRSLRVRRVPTPPSKPSFISHARLRRASPITSFAVAAALEALGTEGRALTTRLGVVVCVMTGCVNYSSRFYGEVLRDAATASPLVFPETVFNAPSSHLAALLGTSAINYTLVGDPGTFLQGLALGAHWILEDEIDGCLVVGAEEGDWLSSDAYRLFDRNAVLAEGAGALFLRRAEEASAGARLSTVTSSHNYSLGVTREEAAARMAEELFASGRPDLLCDGAEGSNSFEATFWKGWSGARLSPKRIVGEGLAAASAWQCAAAIDCLFEHEHQSATVSVLGCNQQAIGARFDWNP